MPTTITNAANSWPHRLAVLLVCATFPLIWVGGLVTSYEAGMAVPDWPSTYGSNLFLYPWQTWLFGPFDIFVEHGHRLLGALVGMITIAFVASIWLTTKSRFMRALSVGALVLVIGQGVLGGMRVVLDARDLAKLHGCVGPLFFALTVTLATITSQRWNEISRPMPSSGAGSLHRLAIITAGLSYSQIVLGAQLRHLTPGIEASFFRTMLVFHLIVAALVLLHIGLLYARVRRDHHGEPWLRRPATLLLALVIAQLGLGASTWIVNYGWPVWFGGYAWAQEFIVRQESMRQALVTTAHVAIGSLIFATAVLFTVRSFRLAPAHRSEMSTVKLAASGVAL